MKIVGITGLAIIAIITFDIGAALLSASLGIPFGLFSIGSLFIYVVTGFLVGRISRWFYGGLSGAIAGLAESTIGWAVSWNFVPDIPEIEMEMGLMIGILIVGVMFCASIFGLFGGIISLLMKRNA